MRALACGTSGDRVAQCEFREDEKAHKIQLSGHFSSSRRAMTVSRTEKGGSSLDAGIRCRSIALSRRPYNAPCASPYESFKSPMSCRRSAAMRASSLMAATDWDMPSAVSEATRFTSSMALLIFSDTPDCSSAAPAMP